MSTRWIPDDTELDELARALPPHEATRDAAEQNRTALLAAAATRTQQPPRSILPYAIGGAAIAAAAAVAIWLAVRPSSETEQVALVPAKQVITPIGAARYERVTDWDDFVVRLDDGKLSIQVATLAAGERFRVKTADAEVEARGARFVIGADQGRIASVAVQEGRAEIRVIGQQVIVLAAGETWAPTRTAIRDDVDLRLPAPVVPPPPITPKPPAKPAKLATTKPAPPKLEAPPAPAIPPPPQPGEAEFRAGMTALRAGDPRGAQTSFASACTIARKDAFGEDACFWSGAAAKRAGDAAVARAALSAYLHDFPASARAAEAAALLGWIVYDAGELDAAEKLFERAVHDRVPQVRESAERGLTAIRRKRP
jgi:TolA-binding protein